MVTFSMTFTDRGPLTRFKVTSFLKLNICKTALLRDKVTVAH